jgi:2-methylisocitrate lyase-like PEP mutase family enzyme
VQKILDKAKADGRTSLTAPEGKLVCDAYGITVPKEGVAATAAEAAGLAAGMGFPVVLKIVSPEILHKTEAGGVLVGVKTTADVEAGFGSTPEEVAETARAVIDAGAVGMNLEDGAEDKPDFLENLNKQKEIIRAVLETAKSADVPFVLNARTDIFLYGIGPAETRLHRAIERLNAYCAAGAQSLFVPGVKDKETIAQLARGIAGPLNILATAGTPPVAELQELGVARVSVGSGPMRATLGFLGRLARELREDGVFKMMTDGALPYADANRLMRPK